MSAERNTAREWRRALARQNALANEIAAACASGRVPDRRLVAEWSLASMRVYARENHLRPRECGTALGEAENNGSHIPAVETAGTATQGNAAPIPAPFPNTQPDRKETMNNPNDPCSGCIHAGDCPHGRPFRDPDGFYDCDLRETEPPANEEGGPR